MRPSETLANSVVETWYVDVPEEVTEHAKLAIRDFIGVAIYGANHEIGEQISDYVDQCYAGNESSLITGEKTTPAGAALANGTFGHAIDYDDTFESIVIHPTAPIFPAALAVGEAVDASGKEVLLGYIVGCETSYRVGQSVYPDHIEDGWHCTGTAGSFGAAAAAAKVLDLDGEQTAKAFGIVASGSSALKKNFGTMTKPLHAGHAAEQGVRAAMLASNGFTASPEIFEGKLGYCEVMIHGEGRDPTDAFDQYGDEWAVLDIGFKPYPSGVITHAAMDALRVLIQEEKIKIGEISEIRVALDDAASEMLHHKRPSNALEAKFSIEFCLAAVLLSEDPGVQEFTDEYVSRQEVQKAIRLVTREFERNLFGGDFANYGARVKVETVDGTEYVKEMREAPGTPSNPVETDRLRDKVVECIGETFDQNRIELLDECITELDSRPVSEFGHLIREP